MDMKKITAALVGLGAITLPQLSFSSTNALDKVDYISVSVSSSGNRTPAIFNNGRSQAEIRVKFNITAGMDDLTEEELKDLNGRLTIGNRVAPNVKVGEPTEDDIASDANQFYIQETENIFDPVPSSGEFYSTFAANDDPSVVNNTIYRYVTATGMPKGNMEVCAMIDGGKPYGGVEFNTCNDENSPMLEVREGFQYSLDDIAIETRDIERKDSLNYRLYEIKLRHHQFPETKIKDARIIGEPLISKVKTHPEGVMLRGAFKVKNGVKVDGSEGGKAGANYLMRPLHLYENAPQANSGILPLMAGCWIPVAGSIGYYSDMDFDTEKKKGIDWTKQPIRLPTPRTSVNNDPTWLNNIISENVLGNGSLNCIRFEVKNESTETRRKMPLTVNYPLPFNKGELSIYDNYGNRVDAELKSDGWNVSLIVN